MAVPFVRYQLRLHHGLLDALGELSHFLLAHLGNEGVDLAMIRRATGLTAIELEPVLQRMTHLQLLAGDAGDATLTPTGQRLSGILRNGLHGSSRDIWVDALGSSQEPVIVLDPAVFLAADDEADYHLQRTPTRTVERLHSDQRRLDRHRALIAALRAQIWADDAAQFEIRDERLQRAAQWMLSLEPAVDAAQDYWLPIDVPLNEPERSLWLVPDGSPQPGHPAFRVDLPALLWSVTYAPPRGLVPSSPQPEPVRLAACGVNADPLDSRTVDALPDTTEHPVPAGWRIREETLLSTFEDDTPPVAARWSRLVEVAVRWRHACIQPTALLHAARAQHLTALLHV